jgi:type III secretion protein W
MGSRCHTGKHSSCTGVSMKVESNNDVQTIRPLDQAAISHTSVPAPAKGIDELAHLFGQEVELNSRALSGRKMTVRVPPVEQLAQLYDQLGHPAKKTLAFLSLLFRQQLQGRPTVENLLKLADGDPARAFVVLKHVVAKAGSEVRQSDATLARDAIARLEARFKGEIQAGLNIALALQSAGVDPQERQALRLLYYANVVTRQSLSTMMQALLGVYGGEQFHVGLQVMRKALADDIAAKVSSMPTPLLRTLLQGLRDCGQLSSVLAGCNELIGRLGIEHDAVGLLQRLLAYAGGGIEAAEALRLANDLGGGSFLQQLLALQAIYLLFKQLPLALWSDNQVRRDTLTRLVMVVDELDRHMRGPTRHAGEPRTMT